MVRGSGAAVIAAVVWMLAAVPATAQEASPQEGESEARMHFRLGRAYYDSGRFDEAAREFALAYEQSQRPALLYNLYVAYRDAARMREAADALERYLSLEAEVENREQLEARLQSIQTALAADPPPAASPEERADPSTARSTASSPSSSPPSAGGGGPWTPGWIIAGAGGAVIVAGVITGVLALDTQARLESEHGCTEEGACPPGFEGTRDEGALLAGLTDGFLIGGAIVAAAGVVLALVLSDGSGDSTTAGVACGPEGCMGHVRGSF